MRYLKKFEGKEDIDAICKKYDIISYTINSDGSIDVRGYVNLYNRGLTELPLKFGDVRDSFSCSKNKLTSLAGSPESVDVSFYCQDNKLTSLEGGPKIVNMSFGCDRNNLTSLKGAPRTRNHFSATDNQIRDIYDIPQIDGHIFIKNNPVYTLVKVFINREDKEHWIEFFNDCDIIRDDHIIWERLVFFYDYLDIKIDDEWKSWIKEDYKIVE